MPYDAQVIADHGFTPEEYAKVCEHLGREPRYVELGIFSVMWSEHCSYKSSRLHLKRLPTKGPQVVCGPGENAGIVDLGDGLCACFKMESHNHPSFIEPYQGAATGVGGIMRDIFTMGARPVALLNSLRFGDPSLAKTKSLIHGVVAGIAGYGNCMGVPTVGGETLFAPSFNGNNLVNAFCVGILKQDKIFKAQAAGIGNPIIYVGAKTGRDGIHGATMASAEFDEASEEKRPTVQVGDPFTEKRLLEACQELMAGGDIIAIQDMGAAGLTCSSLEMAASGRVGVELDLDDVPCRETEMSAYEIMLSESQERMLLVAKQGSEDRVRAIFTKWDLDAAVVGKVVEGDQVVIRFKGDIVAELPSLPITEDAPIYDRPQQEPKYLKVAQQLDLSKVPDTTDVPGTLKQLVSSPNLCSKKWIYRQYDHMVGTDTVVLPGSDAAVLRLKGTARGELGDKGLGLSVDCNSRYCYLDPQEGAKLAVAECARNLVCSGAKPLASTDCLNFGNPENPEIMWQIAKAIDGIAEACEALAAPIVSGNVSLYNETQGQAIDPTPGMALIGLLDDVNQHCCQYFQKDGDLIVLLGWFQPTLGASEYLATVHGLVQGHPPVCDLEQERQVQDCCLQLIKRGVIRSAHDLSMGGLAVALAESCVSQEGQSIGAHVAWEPEERTDLTWFGETAASILVSVSPEKLPLVIGQAQASGCPAIGIGSVGGEVLQLGDEAAIPLTELSDWYWNSFEKLV